MRELRRNPVLFKFLSLDLAHEGWKFERQRKEAERQNKKGDTFAISEDDEDDDRNAYFDWLFGDKLPPETEDAPLSRWRKAPPSADVSEVEADDDFEDLNDRLKNYRKT